MQPQRWDPNNCKLLDYTWETQLTLFDISAACRSSRSRAHFELMIADDFYTKPAWFPSSQLWSFSFKFTTAAKLSAVVRNNDPIRFAIEILQRGLKSSRNRSWIKYNSAQQDGPFPQKSKLRALCTQKQFIFIFAPKLYSPDLPDHRQSAAFLIVFIQLGHQMSVAAFAFCCASALKQSAPRSSRLFSSSFATHEALKFCVVGSGPAGFYTVDKVHMKLRQLQSIISIP